MCINLNAENNPIRNIDPDGMATYPIVTITTKIIGKTKQRVLGLSNSLKNPKKFASATVNIYKAVVTDTEDPNFRMEFGVTRDAFGVTKQSYKDAYKDGKGEGPRNAANAAFEPANGNDNVYEASEKTGGYPKGGPSALYLTRDGDTQLPSSPRPAAAELGFGKTNSADGVMIHAGGYYKYGSKTNLAASEACFGVVNAGNSPNNPSNATVNNVVGTIVDQAKKSQTNPGLIQVIVKKRKEFERNKTVNP